MTTPISKEARERICRTLWQFREINNGPHTADEIENGWKRLYDTDPIFHRTVEEFEHQYYLAINTATAAKDAEIERLKEVAENNGRMVDVLRLRRDELINERDQLRQQLNNHCACEHDGRGNLVAECQEHEELRKNLDKAREALENLLKDDSPYPLDETANILVEAVQVLLNEKNYDGDQHERFAVARNFATLIPCAVKFAREALTLLGGKDAK